MPLVCMSFMTAMVVVVVGLEGMLTCGATVANIISFKIIILIINAMALVV